MERAAVWITARRRSPDQPAGACDREDVGNESGALLAGDLCNTNVFDPSDPASRGTMRKIFEDPVQWAVDVGVDDVSQRPSPTREYGAQKIGCAYEYTVRPDAASTYPGPSIRLSIDACSASAREMFGSCVWRWNSVVVSFRAEVVSTDQLVTKSALAPA